MAPNFQRLAERTATFETSYVASMPCMPARRDLMTGRPNFLHRAWGPMEPYDDCLPELLRNAGVYTHLISDHQHYWEEGGANYHTKYNTWEIVRGQEGDPWIPRVKTPTVHPPSLRNPKEAMVMQDQINREVMPGAEDQPMSGVFRQARHFLDANRTEDNWFLQVETFDPHEPFFTHRRYKDLYPEHYRNYKGPAYDWPPYRKVEETPEEVEQLRHEYLALVSMCDEKLGDILDYMDAHEMWEDTLLIVGTDHGFLLGEHDCWAKCWMPFYEEVARTPFFVWDPRSKVRGERRRALVQPSLDIGPTVLGFFGAESTPHMTGYDLEKTIAKDAPVRDSAIFGMFGSHVNITDGRYVYMRGNPEGQTNQPLNEYTLMPVRMKKAFSLALFQEPIASRTFNFTKGCHLMQIPVAGGMPGGEDMTLDFATKLYDLEKDPHQMAPILDADVEERFCVELNRHFIDLDAPEEQWVRLGLTRPDL